MAPKSKHLSEGTQEDGPKKKATPKKKPPQEDQPQGEEHTPKGEVKTSTDGEELRDEDEKPTVPSRSSSASRTAPGEEEPLGGKIGKADWNQLRYQLHKAAKEGQPELLEGYKKLSSQAAKRDFLKHFTIDKEMCDLRAVEACTSITENTNDRVHGWLTRAQIVEEEA